MCSWTAALVLWGAQAPAASPQREDFLVLADGRVIEGKQLARADGGIRIHFENGDVFVPKELVRDCLISGEAAAEPAGDEERAQLAKGNVHFEGRWMTKKQRDDQLAKRVADRKQYFAALAARREWRNRAKQTTKHFAFEYTLPDDVFTNYRDLMETYFEVFVRDWKIKLPRDLGPLTVCLHVDQEAMIQVGGAGRGVLGYFKFVRPMELNF